MMDGLLVVDKPVGPTSHDVVARVRRALGEPRIGHTGTLDPAATGVLPLVLGRATRLARFLSAGDKSYEAVVRLGSPPTRTMPRARRSGRLITGALAVDARRSIARSTAFRGTFLQQPPAFSAKKIGGRRSYRARATREARALPFRPSYCALAPVTRHCPRDQSVLGRRSDVVTLRIDCSAGFYVRALAHDLGVRLGIGAHLLVASSDPERRRRRSTTRWRSTQSSANPAAGRRAIGPSVARCCRACRRSADRRRGAPRRPRARSRSRRHSKGVGIHSAARQARRPFSSPARSGRRSGGDCDTRKGPGLLHPAVVLV